MLIDLSLAVQLVLADAIKCALGFPGHSGDTMHCPAHAYETILRLPDSADFHIQLLEEDATMEAQGPKYQPVVLHAGKCIAGIPETDILAIDIVCRRNEVSTPVRK